MIDDSFRQIGEVMTSFRNGLGLDMASVEIILKMVPFILPMIVIQAIQYRRDDHLFFMRIPRYQQVLFFGFIALWWLLWSIQGGDAFVYFQF
jgi:hypothetical protein